jgi:hypothetical protein
LIFILQSLAGLQLLYHLRDAVSGGPLLPLHLSEPGNPDSQLIIEPGLIDLQYALPNFPIKEHIEPCQALDLLQEHRYILVGLCEPLLILHLHFIQRPFEGFALVVFIQEGLLEGGVGGLLDGLGGLPSEERGRRGVQLVQLMRAGVLPVRVAPTAQ